MALEVLELDKYYMSIAVLASNLSDYTNTKVGACIVKDGKILSVGHNHLMHDIKNYEVPENNISTDILLQRNSYSYHAEQDAIFNYSGLLQDLNGSTVYVNISPCHECTKLLIGFGVKEIVYKEKYHQNSMTKMSEILLKRCNIVYRQLKED